jgi:hypothetical protein
VTTRGTFKGNPTISMQLSKGFPFTFGLDKARAILANLADIQTFVAEHGGMPQMRGSGSANPWGKEIDPGELAADRWNESQGGNGGSL